MSVYLYRVIEAPKRWRGKAIWITFAHFEGPIRVSMNGVFLQKRDWAGGTGLDLPVSRYLVPGSTNLLVIRAFDAETARQMIQDDPPILYVASDLHIDTLHIRPVTSSGVFWVDAKLRQFPQAGALSSSIGALDLESDLYSVEFHVFSASEKAKESPVPNAKIRSLRMKTTRSLCKRRSG